MKAKRIILTMLVIVYCSVFNTQYSTINAQTGVPRLVVWQKSGEKAYFDLNKLPETSFGDGMLTIKSSTATILTLVMLLLLLGLIEGIIQTSANVETWWMLTNALDSLIFVFGPVGGVSMTDAEILRAAGVMVAWGVVTNVIAFLLFRKRDF